MSDALLTKLRILRSEATELLPKCGSDLAAFLNDDKRTFLRTPTSPRSKDDVNVTTTCSCLMALALANRLEEVYNTGWKAKVRGAFDRLVDAPWMSSGLTENNAFTTALVIRTLGFLLKENILPNGSADTPKRKQWQRGLGTKNSADLIRKIKSSKAQTFWDFVWRSLTDKTRAAVDAWDISSSTKEQTNDLSASVSLEIQRLIEGSWIYNEKRFPTIKKNTKKRLLANRRAYDRADANRELLAEEFPEIFSSANKLSFKEIAREMSSEPSNFRINDYQPAAAIIYWFIHGVHLAGAELDARAWDWLCEWATKQFNHQRSLVEAQHAAMMDPVAMAMSACLCARLRVISDTARPGALKIGANNKHLSLLPSKNELEHSIRTLLKHQTNGIWPKYFPLFHYQDAASNFCFTFELLEAVLVEFSDPDYGLLDDDAFLDKLSQSVNWCKENRLSWPAKDGDPHPEYCGWNSGGYLESLEKGQPESWATAVVYMFLWELTNASSERIQRLLLNKYHARFGQRRLSQLLDIEILEKGEPAQLRTILEKQIIVKHRNKNEQILRRCGSDAVRSALLFGPPGTSKTNLTEAIAAEIGWRLIQIDPSHFLRRGLDQIYTEADTIFEDLDDLSGVVVLFDEMDALVQTRDSAVRLETAAQFLTTFMLPQLTRLHGHARIVYFMATNFQERFDAAIKRPGRFDLLLCMGPPSLSEKLASIHVFLDERSTTSSQEVASLIRSHLKKHPRIEMQLELYTFSEFKTLLSTFGNKMAKVAEHLKKISAAQFAEQVSHDSQFVYLKVRDLWPLRTLRIPIPTSIADFKKLNLTWELAQTSKMILTPVLRYALDLKESRATAPD